MRTYVLDDGAPSAASGADSPVPWWSFGKAVLATAALRLVDQGRLDLDAPAPGATHTLRQLLQHRSGLPEYARLPAYNAAVAAGEPAWTRGELLTCAAALPHAPPETTWTYSNIGYLHVREIIETAVGAPLGAALAALVFEPLEIPGVRLASARDDLAGIEMGAGRGYDPRWVYHGLLVGPLSSAALLLDRVLAGGALTDTGLAQMRAGWPLPEFSGPIFAKAGYGLGLMVCETASGQPIVGHTGGGPGSGAAVYSFAKDGHRRTVAVWGLAEEGNPEQAALDLGVAP